MGGKDSPIIAIRGNFEKKHKDVRAKQANDCRCYFAGSDNR